MRDSFKFYEGDRDYWCIGIIVETSNGDCSGKTVSRKCCRGWLAYRKSREWKGQWWDNNSPSLFRNINFPSKFGIATASQILLMPRIESNAAQPLPFIEETVVIIQAIRFRQTLRGTCKVGSVRVREKWRQFCASNTNLSTPHITQVRQFSNLME